MQHDLSLRLGSSASSRWPDVRPDIAVRDVAGRYLDELFSLLDLLDLKELEDVVTALRTVRREHGTVYVAGNGGSAATASHWVNDLCKATKLDGHADVRAASLTDNTSWLTALANDEGYERVFAGQIESLAREGDALVVISASGNSPNLVEAVRLARERRVVTVGLLGFDGGALKDLVDHSLWLPTDPGRYGLVESAHSVLCDILTTCVAAGGGLDDD
jgi:D-sedoheptulose 7-phosphate isomerase